MLPTKLCMVAIFKNEAPYLAEWIAHHRLQGFDHFLLHDNDSTDDYMPVLEPFIAAGFVSVVKMPGKNQQLPCYAHATAYLRGRARWVAYMDVDEFLVPQDPAKTIHEILDTEFEFASAVGVHWKIFGDSGLASKPEGGVMENYVWRREDNFRIPGGDVEFPNRHIKTIADPSMLTGFRNPHQVAGPSTFDTDKHHVYSPFPDPVTYAHMSIHHYFTKSAAEFDAKRARGRADCQLKRSASEREQYSGFNVRDESALPFAAKVKEYLSGFTQEKQHALTQRPDYEQICAVEKKRSGACNILHDGEKELRVEPEGHIKSVSAVEGPMRALQETDSAR